MTSDTDRARRATSWALKRLQAGASWVVQHTKAVLRQMVRGPSEGWMTFIFLVLSVLLAVWIVGNAQWVPTPGLYSMALCSVVLGLILAKMRSNPWRLSIGGLLLGLVLSFYQLTSLAEGVTRLERLAEIGTRLFAWWQALVGGGTSSDTLAFSFFVVLTSWLVGFVSSWFLFRKHSIWGALLPGGVAVVASLINVPSREQMFYLHLYLFVAFLLGARLFSLERRLEWEKRGVQHLPADSVLRLPEAFWLAMAVVLATSLLPMEPARINPVAAAWDRMSSPARAIGEELARVLIGVPGGNPDSGHSFGPTQPFDGGTTLREEPVLIVEAPFPIYLRARSYDVYTHRGWETGETRLVPAGWTPEQSTAAEFWKLHEVEVMIRDLPSLATDEPLYLGGRPIDISTGYQLEVPDPARYRIQIDEGGLESSLAADGLPPDLEKTAQRLLELSTASGGRLIESEITSVLPEDVWMVAWDGGVEGVATITLERRFPIPPDTLSVRTTGPLAAGGSYRATVQVSAATEGDLRAAGAEYPGWVLDRYLQLPDSMPSRVVDLARELTGSAENPYDMAVAVRDYLRTLDYSLEIEAPSDGVDGVDYFLFDVREGYCQYFASAMTVLLRACGVPCRMVVGYGPGETVDVHSPEETIGPPPGEWQTGPLTFVVRDSHSWSEVFFPGYGWIPFESTPVCPLITRGNPFPPSPGGGEDGGGVLPDQGGDTDSFPDDADGIVTGAARYVWPLGVSLGLALLGMIAWLGWRRLLGQVSEPRTAYARIGYLAALSGLSPGRSLTPYEYGRLLAVAVPDMSADLDTVVDTYVRACYGRCNLTCGDLSRVAEAWPRVRNGLLRRAMSGLLPRRFW